MTDLSKKKNNNTNLLVKSDVLKDNADANAKSSLTDLGKKKNSFRQNAIGVTLKIKKKRVFGVFNKFL